jgi:hypothetical protein
VSEVAAISPAQINVREQNIDHLLAENDLGLFGTCSSQNRKASIFQSLGSRSANHKIIFNDQNTGAACFMRCALGSEGSSPMS